MRSKLNRRRFIVNSLAAGGVAALDRISPLVAPASAAPAPETTPGTPTNNRYYIFCYFQGGWDILLGLDPRDPDVFTPAMAPNTRIMPGYNTLTSTPNGNGVYLPDRLQWAGMGTTTSVGAYLGDLSQEPYLSKIAIVRGVNTNTLAHDVGAVRARTGRPPAGNQPRGSSGATWLASHYSQDELVPNLSIREAVYNLDLPALMTPLNTSTVQDLVSVLRPQSSLVGDFAQQQIDQLIAQTSQCPEAVLSPFRRASQETRIQTSELLGQNMWAQFDFGAQTAEMQSLRSAYGFAANQVDSSQARAALAVRAITSGMSRCVSLRVNDASCDTHFTDWGTIQGVAQMEGFNNIARMIDGLESTPHPDGGTWFDYVTIVAYSEFSRTPMLNQFTGRDHWLCSAYLLAGADIQGGQVVGASSDVGMAPVPIDLATGAIDNVSGEVLRPDHVYQTLMYAAGFNMDEDPGDYRVQPIQPLLKP